MKSNLIFIVCTIFLFCSRDVTGPDVNGPYHSGEFVIFTPVTEGQNTFPFDFSEADDSCCFYGGCICSVLTADAEIVVSRKSNIDTLYSNYGILDLGTFGANGLSQIGKVPSTGYINKIAIQLHHIYAIKTSEGHFGALFYKDIIFGGYDNNIYRWAYQENGSNDLTPP